MSHRLTNSRERHLCRLFVFITAQKMQPDAPFRKFSICSRRIPFGLEFQLNGVTLSHLVLIGRLNSS